MRVRYILVLNIILFRISIGAYAPNDKLNMSFVVNPIIKKNISNHLIFMNNYSFLIN